MAEDKKNNSPKDQKDKSVQEDLKKASSKGEEQKLSGEKKASADSKVSQKAEASPDKKIESVQKEKSSQEKEQKATPAKEQSPKEKEQKATASQSEEQKSTQATEAKKEKVQAVDGQKATASQSEENKTNKTSEKTEVKTQKQDNTVKLEGLFAFKMSMTTFYNDKGESVPVTALKYEPCRISQIKNVKKESYDAIQVAFKAQKNKRCSKANINHLKPAGFKEGARFIKEIRQAIPEGLKLGQELSIESLKKGDLVKISSLSKGRGFTGVMKRWNFSGGKASHGSKSHRRVGSIGQHTEPARVMPGRKMPGQYGFKQSSKLKVPVVEVLPEEGIIFVKGPVPGARNTLVSIRKMSHPSS